MYKFDHIRNDKSVLPSSHLITVCKTERTAGRSSKHRQCVPDKEAMANLQVAHMNIFVLDQWSMLILCQSKLPVLNFMQTCSLAKEA